jgi:glycosyltransferase involved in cell wall biosynthesis
MLLSFVIPAYNAADYIKSCIKSIFALDLHGRDFEVIVVNDGSTDNTAEVLEDCMREYALKTISQDNMGPSVARNAGLSYTKGKYVAFVDADDELISTSDISSLISLMEGDAPDIIGVNLRQRDFNGKEAPYRRYVPTYNKCYAPAYKFMTGRNIFPCIPAYMFRKEFLDRKGLELFPKKFHEDEEFTPRAFALADSFVALNIDWYLRILRKESITTTTDPEKQKRNIRDMLRILARMTDFAMKSPHLRIAMSCKLDYMVVDLLLLLHKQGHDKEFQREVLAELRRMNRFPLRWRNEIKYIAFNLWTRIFL